MHFGAFRVDHLVVVAGKLKLLKARIHLFTSDHVQEIDVDQRVLIREMHLVDLLLFHARNLIPLVVELVGLSDNCGQTIFQGWLLFGIRASLLYVRYLSLLISVF